MKQQTEPKTTLQFVEIERAIVYARVSTDEQAETGTSINNQVEKSLAYAEANNMNVVGIFKEDCTGKVLDRPELNKVREMLRNGQADNLIVYKTNRLDRSEWGVNLLILMQELKTLGVDLHYSQDNRKVDLHNPMEAFMYGSFAGWQAGEDHRETVTKLHEGRRRRAQDGYVVPHGDAPYGYKAVRGEDRQEQPEDLRQRKIEEKKWFFEIDKNTSEIVRLIFRLYVFGDEAGEVMSLGKVADRLNDLGIPTKTRGKAKKWQHAQIHYILSNETYAGVWHYGKKNHKVTSKSIPVPVPSIVEREVWEQAQKRLKENKKQSERNRKPGKYLLAGRLTCGDCHYAMCGVTRKPENKSYFYYKCRNKQVAKRERTVKCNNVSFNSQIVDANSWQWIEEIASDRDKLIEGLQSYQSQQESEVAPIRKDLALVEQLIQEKNQELDEEIESLSILTSRRAKAKKAADIEQLESVLDGLEANRDKLLSQLETKSITDEQIIGITAFASQVANDLVTLREAEEKGKASPELKMAVYYAKRKLLAMLDVQLTLFVEDGKKKGRITAKFCPNGDILSLELDSICTGQLAR